MKQPEPIHIVIPIEFVGNTRKFLYSAMPINSLVKLRAYLDDLIKWKGSASPVCIAGLTYEDLSTCNKAKVNHD